MSLKRIIPCLLTDGTGLVKTHQFSNPAYVGDPINVLKIFNDKEVDEIILLDIMATKQKRKPNFELIEQMAGEAFMPFTYGGGITEMTDIKKLFKCGIEKISVNTSILSNPEILKEAVEIYGSQAIVGSIDYKKNWLGKTKPYFYSGKSNNMSLLDYALYLQNEIKVGEILLTSVDREGTWSGYDIALYKEFSEKLSIPTIANGGCGQNAHLTEILTLTKVSAAAVGSMAVYSKQGMGVLINFPKREMIIKD